MQTSTIPFSGPIVINGAYESSMQPFGYALLMMLFIGGPIFQMNEPFGLLVCLLAYPACSALKTHLRREWTFSVQPNGDWFFSERPSGISYLSGGLADIRAVSVVEKEEEGGTWYQLTIGLVNGGVRDVKLFDDREECMNMAKLLSDIFLVKGRFT